MLGGLFVLTVAYPLKIELGLLPASPTWHIGLMLGLGILATAVRWRALYGAWRASRAPFRRLADAVVAGAVLAALLFNVSGFLGESPFLAAFGLWPTDFIVAFCFALTATGALGWRGTLGVLLLGYVTAHALSMSLGSAAVPAPEAGLPITAGSAALLGAILLPWLRQRQTAPLRQWPTTVALGVILLAQFAGGRLYTPAFVVPLDFLSLNGVAFVVALAWGHKGLLAAPIVVQLCTLLSFAWATERLGLEISTLVTVGLSVFPYAVAGFLAADPPAALTHRTGPQPPSPDLLADRRP